MKAAVLFKKKKIKILSLKIPPLKRGQVLVKLLYSGVCKSQVMEYLQLRGRDKYLPHLLGHEAVGEVLDTGAYVKKVKAKDKVILSWIKSSGIESMPPVFQNKNKKINAGKITTFSTVTIVSENRLIKKPKKMPDIFATLCGCAFLTGAGLILNKLEKKNKNDIILVYGLGGVGLAAISCLLSLGYKRVIGLDKSNYKLNLAKELGCKYLINNSNKNYKKKIFGLFKKKVDICLEFAGSANTIMEGFDLIDDLNGVLFFASHPAEKEKIIIKPFELIRGKKIYGVWGGHSNPDIDIHKINNKIKTKHKIFFEKISKIYSLFQIEKALRDLQLGKTFRPVIRF